MSKQRMKYKKMKHKKVLTIIICLFILTFVVLSIGLRYSKYANRNIKEMISIEMQLLDADNISILSTTQDGNNIELTYNFIVQSDFACQAQMMVLKNFEITPFSLNGKEERTMYSINIEKSDKYLQSLDNKLLIQNLDSYNNDLCILILFEKSIFTKRFQVLNTSIKDEFSNKKYIEVNTVKDFDFEERYLSYNMDIMNLDGGVTYLDDILHEKTINCAINIEKIIESSNTYEEYLSSEKEKLTYAIIPVINDGEFFGNVVYMETEKK